MGPQEQLAASVGTEEAATLWPHLELQKYRPGMVIFREGVPSQHLHFLVSGSLTVSIGTSDGSVSLGVIHPGAWLGEIGFVDEGAATATVAAGEPSLTLRISRDTLLELKNTHPHAAAVLLRTVTKQLATRLTRSTAGIVEQVAEGRYQLREAEENQGWLKLNLGWLLGIRSAS